MVDQTAQVRLTADASQFQQAMGAAAQSVTPVVAASGQLTRSWDQAGRSMSQSLKMFRHEAVAQFSGVTQAAAAMNTQLASLKGTLGASGRSNMLDNYRSQISRISSELKGVSQGQVVDLMTQSVQSGKSVSSATSQVTTAVKMGQATGQDAGSLMSSMSSLQRAMGAAAPSTSRLADDITALSSKMGTASSTIAEFANSISPIAGTIGLTTKEVLAFSAAASKSGQDSMAAATVFSRLFQQISVADRYGVGGKDLASAAHMRVGDFNKLSSTEKTRVILSSLAQGGTEALGQLDRLGLDGPRSVRAIQGMARSGQLDRAFGIINGNNSGAVDQGYSEASTGLNASRQRLQNQLSVLGQHAGTKTEPMAAAFTDMLSEIVKAGTPLAKLFIDLAAPIKGVLAVLSLATKALGLGGLVGAASMGSGVLKSGTALGASLSLVGGNIERLPFKFMRETARAMEAGKIRDASYVQGARRAASIGGIANEEFDARFPMPEAPQRKKFFERWGDARAAAEANVAAAGGHRAGPVTRLVQAGAAFGTFSQDMTNRFNAHLFTDPTKRTGGYPNWVGDRTMDALAGAAVGDASIKRAGGLVAGTFKGQFGNIRRMLGTAAGVARDVPGIYRRATAGAAEDVLPPKDARYWNQAIAEMPESYRVAAGIHKAGEAAPRAHTFGDIHRIRGQVEAYDNQRKAAEEALHQKPAPKEDAGAPKVAPAAKDAAAAKGPVSVLEQMASAANEFMTALHGASERLSTFGMSAEEAAKVKQAAAQTEADASNTAAQANQAEAEASTAAAQADQAEAGASAGAASTGVSPFGITDSGEGLPVPRAPMAKKFGSRMGASMIIGAASNFAGGALAKDGHEDIGNVVQGAGSAASMGAMLGGPWGALIGAGVGAGMSAFSNNQASKKRREEVEDAVRSGDTKTALDSFGLSLRDAANHVGTFANAARAAYEALPTPRTIQDASLATNTEWNYARSQGYQLQNPSLQQYSDTGGTKKRDTTIQEAAMQYAVLSRTPGISNTQLQSAKVDLISLLPKGTSMAAFNAAIASAVSGDLELNPWAGITGGSSSNEQPIDAGNALMSQYLNTLKPTEMSGAIAGFINAIANSDVSVEARGQQRKGLVLDLAGRYDLSQNTQNTLNRVLPSGSDSGLLRGEGTYSIRLNQDGKWETYDTETGTTHSLNSHNHLSHLVRDLNTLPPEVSRAIALSQSGQGTTTTGKPFIGTHDQDYLLNSQLGRMFYRQTDSSGRAIDNAWGYGVDHTYSTNMSQASAAFTRGDYSAGAEHYRTAFGTTAAQRATDAQANNVGLLLQQAAGAQGQNQGMNLQAAYASIEAFSGSLADFSNDANRMAASADGVNQSFADVMRAASTLAAKLQSFEDIDTGRSQMGGYIDPSVMNEFYSSVEGFNLDDGDSPKSLGDTTTAMAEARAGLVQQAQGIERGVRSMYRQQQYSAEDYATQWGSQAAGNIDMKDNPFRTASNVAPKGYDALSQFYGQQAQNPKKEAPYQQGRVWEDFWRQRGDSDIEYGITRALTLKRNQRALDYSAADFWQQRGWSQDDYNLQRKYQIADYDKNKRRSIESFERQEGYSKSDFEKQRARGEEDYNRQINRALDSYNLNRNRQEADFNKNRLRQQSDFDKQRRRAEEDFARQQMRLAENTSKQMFDVQNRMQAKPTWSASGMANNLQQKVAHFRKQLDDIKELRGMGLSDNTIKQLGLLEAGQGQQVSRLLNDLKKNAGKISELNALSSQMIDIGGQFGMHELNDQWQDTKYSFEQSQQRAMEDFNESMSRSQADFAESMARQAEDFSIQMTNMAEDYNVSVSRMVFDFNEQLERSRTEFGIQLSQGEEDFQESLRRSEEQYQTSLDRQLKQFNESQRRTKEANQEALDEMDAARARSNARQLRDIIINQGRAEEELEKSNARQEEEMVRSHDVIRDISTETLNLFARHNSEYTGMLVRSIEITEQQISGAHTLMQETGTTAITALKTELGKLRDEWSAIFGVSIPDAAKPGGSGGGLPMAAAAAGAVLDGWSPGQDIHTFVSPTGGKLHLGGGESVMVTEWTDQMGGEAEINRQNRAARSGRLREYMASRFGDGDEQSFATGGIVDAANWWVGKGATAGHIHYSRNEGCRAHVSAEHYTGNAADINYYPANQETAFINRWLADFRAAFPDIGILWQVKDHFDHLHINTGGGGSVGSGYGSFFIDPAKLESLRAYPERIRQMLKEAAVLTHAADTMKTATSNVIENSISNLMNNFGGGTLIGGTAIGSGGDAKAIVQAMAAARGWTGAEWNALNTIVQRESGWNPNAANPNSSARGLFQKMTSLHGAIEPTIEGQAQWGLDYIAGRYGTPSAALSFWNKHHWYAGGGTIPELAEGAIFQNKTVIAGESGPELMLPLNQQGASFLADTMIKMAAVPMNTQVSSECSHTGNQTYDSSVNVTGPITVKAEDPNRLGRELEAKARLKRLVTR